MFGGQKQKIALYNNPELLIIDKKNLSNQSLTDFLKTVCYKNL